jgi:hypothetical protein
MLVHSVLFFRVLPSSAIQVSLAPRIPSRPHSTPRSGRPLPFLVAQHGVSSIPSASSKPHPHYALHTLVCNGDSQLMYFQTFTHSSRHNGDIFLVPPSCFILLQRADPLSARSSAPTAEQPAEKVFSLGGRSFSSDVKCLLSTGFQPLKKAFPPFWRIFPQPRKAYIVYLVRYQNWRALGKLDGHDE